MRRARWAVVVVIGILLAACGDGDGGAAEDTTTTGVATTEEQTTTTEAETTTTAGAETTTAAGGATLATAESDLGTILVDGEGRTLYIFTPDEMGEATCVGDCAVNWPPFTGDVTPGEGVDESLVGSVDHPEEGPMVTYGGWPLYYFAADSGPGETTGQGQGGVWFVIGPDGEPIRS